MKFRARMAGRNAVLIPAPFGVHRREPNPQLPVLLAQRAGKIHISVRQRPGALEAYPV
jgi:hypothetical protein